MNPLDVPAHLRDEPRSPPLVLLVGDDPQRTGRVQEWLSRLPVAVAREPRLEAALEAVAGLAPALVVVEAGAPGAGAQDFCRRLRAAGHGAPVVVLAADDDPVERVVCLELGADACLPGDVAPRLLWAQARALLRRAGAPAPLAGDQELRCGALVLDRRSLAAVVRGRGVCLTPHEFDCAWLLAERAGTVVSRAEFRGAMDRGGGGEIRDRTVDSCLSRLRRKLASVDPDPRRIRSVRSRGYLFSLAGL